MYAIPDQPKSVTIAQKRRAHIEKVLATMNIDHSRA